MKTQNQARSRDRSRLRGEPDSPPISQLNSPSTESSPERLTLRKNEAAAALGVSQRTLHKLLKSGQIGSFKLDRAVLIPVAEIKAFIAQQMQRGGLD
jgi:excisionase family DNA binding protein